MIITKVSETAINETPHKVRVLVVKAPRPASKTKLL